jgi:excisionase family DNA binding protein
MGERRPPTTAVIAAEILGCSESMVYKMIRCKQLEGTYYKIGKKTLFMRDKLDEWMKSGGTKFN